MARTTATNFSGGLQFPYATAATDVFHKEDIQTLAQAVDQHDHTAGKGVAVNTTPANASISNAKLGPDVARASLLTNGSFDVWQRGAGPFTSSWSADRWALQVIGTDTLSVSKNTANQDVGSGACAACTFTLGTGAGATNIGQPIIATDFPQVAGRPLSVSVRVRCATAGAVRVGLYNGSAWTYSGFHSGGGAYETLTASVVATGGATQTPASVFFAASCTAYIDNASLVVGSQPSDYVPLHPADDLARCLRYYEVPGSDSTGSMMVSFNASAGSQNGRFPVRWRATKAVTPTVTKVGTWTVSNCGQPTLSGNGIDGVFLALVSTATGDTYTYNNTAGMYLTVEANP